MIFNLFFISVLFNSVHGQQLPVPKNPRELLLLARRDPWGMLDFADEQPQQFLLLANVCLGNANDNCQLFNPKLDQGGVTTDLSDGKVDDASYTPNVTLTADDSATSPTVMDDLLAQMGQPSPVSSPASGQIMDPSLNPAFEIVTPTGSSGSNSSPTAAMNDLLNQMGQASAQTSPQAAAESAATLQYSSPDSTTQLLGEMDKVTSLTSTNASTLSGQQTSSQYISPSDSTANLLGEMDKVVASPTATLSTVTLPTDVQNALDILRNQAINTPVSRHFPMSTDTLIPNSNPFPSIQNHREQMKRFLHLLESWAQSGVSELNHNKQAHQQQIKALEEKKAKLLKQFEFFEKKRAEMIEYAEKEKIKVIDAEEDFKKLLKEKERIDASVDKENQKVTAMISHLEQKRELYSRREERKHAQTTEAVPVIQLLEKSLGMFIEKLPSGHIRFRFNMIDAKDWKRDCWIIIDPENGKICETAPTIPIATNSASFSIELVKQARKLFKEALNK